MTPQVHFRGALLGLGTTLEFNHQPSTIVFSPGAESASEASHALPRAIQSEMLLSLDDDLAKTQRERSVQLHKL